MAPRELINLNWVTPFENRNSLVKFGYLVATLNLFFFLSLNSNAISSKSATVWTSIHVSGIATTKVAFPKSYLLVTLILFWILISLSFNKSYPEKPRSNEPSPSLSTISLAWRYKTLTFFNCFIDPNKSLSPRSETRVTVSYTHLTLPTICSV